MNWFIVAILVVVFGCSIGAIFLTLAGKIGFDMATTIAIIVVVLVVLVLGTMAEHGSHELKL